jgi:hypothetical protein
MKMRGLFTRALMLATTLGCTGCGGLYLYDVTLTPTQLCEIQPSGDICEDEGAPAKETFALEYREGRTFVYFGRESWIAEGLTGERTVNKEEVVIIEPGCTITTTRDLKFDEDGQTFSGTLVDRQETRGPEECGQTPRGERTEFTLAGEATRQL